MNKKHLNIFLFSLMVLWAISCSEFADQAPQQPLDPDLGKTYFFLEEGKYREYDVYEIRYFAVSLSDTMAYQIREEVREPYSPVQAEKAHLIYRFKRFDDAEPWGLDSVWSARVERNRAVVTENNVQFVKMNFPADTNLTWDHNLYKDKPQELIRARSFNEPFTTGFNTFLNATEIEISAFDEPITERDFRLEVYADSIGRVFKEYEVVKYCSDQDFCEIGSRTIQSGRYYRERLIAHGNVNDEE